MLSVILSFVFLNIRGRNVC